MKRIPLLALALLAACSSGLANPDAARWTEHAKNVTITRDDWGIPHIHGKTDADAVFGMIYSQAEDDFNRVEMNFANVLGKMALVKGEAAIWEDLRMHLFVPEDSLKAWYAGADPTLKALMDAWADGLNYYLSKHPEVKPKVITRWEPWMALAFSEGSIGTDIESVEPAGLEAFYGKPALATVSAAPSLHLPEPGGSNGIAIAPSKTTGGHALFLINLHTSFFFRSELQLQSDEGLNAYGAVTWGQFFIYQGFNERLGWMHTSSGVDAIDEYAETVTEKDGRYFYKYGSEERPVTVQQVTIPFKGDSGTGQRTFTVYRTHHGPVVREADGKWVTVRLMNEPVKALTQSWGRTKTRSYAEFRQVMELHTNSSNNTIFASADGDIAYFHGNFVPRRDPAFDWTKPVDGSDPRTEWGELWGVEESPFVHNPANGWLYNTNNNPYSAAGKDSPRQAAFPKYMDTYEENPRGIHAQQVLGTRSDWTLDGLLAAAYDRGQPGFAPVLPAIIAAYDRLPARDSLKAKLREPVDSLRAWDTRWSVGSVSTSLATYWGEAIWRLALAHAEDEDLSIYDRILKSTTPAEKLGALSLAVDRLTADFGTWRTPWGDINRFQRLTGDIVQPYNDSAPSIPVGFPSARWGSLASFGARTWNTRKLYGNYGNSFVAVVEFGDSVRARAITAGGASGDPRSKHFNDQAERYAAGDLREVYFYPNQLAGHVEREYHPGE